MKIHHNTLKKAKAHGLRFGELDADGQYSVVDSEGQILATATDPKDALDLAICALEDDGEGDEAGNEAELSDAELGLEDEDGEPERSVVKAKYRAKYRPNKGHCGDDLAVRLRDAFMTRQDPDTGKPRLDFKAFVEFAKANEVWVDSYRSLKDRHGNRNDGLIRMNCANRLRAKVRKGHKIVL